MSEMIRILRRQPRCACVRARPAPNLRAQTPTCTDVCLYSEPRCNAPAFNKIPPVEYKNFDLMKLFHSYEHIGNSENLGLEHNISQSLEMHYSGV